MDNNKEENKKEKNVIENKSNNKKSRIIIGALIVLILIGVIVVINIGKNNNDIDKKASQEFGDNYCDAVVHIATKDLAVHNCKICGKEFQDSSMRENICDECAKKTDRCNFCGKKLTKEIKQQRNEILPEEK